MSVSSPPTVEAGASQRGRQRALWRVVGIVVTVFVLACTGIVFASLLVPANHAHQEAVYAQHIEHVIVSADEANVTIVGSVGATVAVRSAMTWSGFSRPQVTRTVHGETLRISAACPHRLPTFLGGRCSTNLVVELPRNTGVSVSVDGGSIRAHTLYGTTRLTLGAGDVTAVGIAGSLSIHVDSGAVHGTALRSRSTDVRVLTGDTYLSFAARTKTVRARTSAGSIDIALAPGAYEVRTHSAAGDDESTVVQSATSDSSVIVSVSEGDVHVHYTKEHEHE